MAETRLTKVQKTGAILVALTFAAFVFGPPIVAEGVTAGAILAGLSVLGAVTFCVAWIGFLAWLIVYGGAREQD